MPDGPTSHDAQATPVLQHQQPQQKQPQHLANHHTIVNDAQPRSLTDSSPLSQSSAHTRRLSNDHAGINSNPPMLTRQFVARRISEGETGRLKEELKCQACGKGYKHISSLAKHLWEHTPEWNLTSKLLISKHQQVQLLEAASILVSMNETDTIKEEPESAYETSPQSSESNYHRSMSPATNSVSPSPPPSASAVNVSSLRAGSQPISVQESPLSHSAKAQFQSVPDIPLSTSGSHIAKSPFMTVRRTSMSAYPPTGARRSSVAAALSVSLSESPNMASSMTLDNYTMSRHTATINSPSPENKQSPGEDDLDGEEQRDREERMFGEMDE